MKFEVELISEERSLVRHGEGTVAVVPDGMLVGFLRTVCDGGKTKSAPAKIRRKRGPNKPKETAAQEA